MNWNRGHSPPWKGGECPRFQFIHTFRRLLHPSTNSVRSPTEFRYILNNSVKNIERLAHRSRICAKDAEHFFDARFVTRGLDRKLLDCFDGAFFIQAILLVA